MKKTTSILASTVCLAGSASAQTYSFGAPGRDETWTVPSGVRALALSAWGAGGGTSGGSAAYVAGRLLVRPGQTLTLTVGRAAGGIYYNAGVAGRNFGGGGYAHGISDVLAGSGGGGTFVWLDGALVAAVGGGGGGGGTRVTIGARNTRGGGGGGTYVGGLPGNNPNVGTATGGTQSAGGSVNGGYLHGGDPVGPGGGGGGGYYGGGGGTNAGAYSLFPGAGGSSYWGGLLDPTFESGVAGSVSGNVLPGGANSPDYVAGVGVGGFGSGGSGRVVLTVAPVPEPSSAIVLSLGGLALLRRRRKG